MFRRKTYTVNFFKLVEIILVKLVCVQTRTRDVFIYNTLSVLSVLRLYIIDIERHMLNTSIEYKKRKFEKKFN